MADCGDLHMVREGDRRPKIFDRKEIGMVAASTLSGCEGEQNVKQGPSAEELAWASL